MRSNDQPVTPPHGAPPPITTRPALSPPQTANPIASQPADPPAAASPLAATRTLLFLALLLFLNLQADGFPLGHGTTFQLRLLPLTLLFLSGLLVLLWPGPLARTLPAALLRPFAARQTLVSAIALFVLLAAALLYIESRVYARFGYQAHPAALVALTLLGIAALRTCLRASATRLLAVTLTLITAFSLFSLRSFPLDLQRSDMLPLLAAANHTLLAHHNPYRLYTFPTEHVFLTYLPGTLLSFLPATLLHLDLRLTNLLAFLLLTVIVIRAGRPTRLHEIAALLALFLLGPYLLYRHDLYTPPHWLALTAALLLAQQRRPRIAAVLFGLSIAMSQFSWILLPFLLLFLLEQHGRRVALQALALALLTAATLTLPFVLADPHAFFLGTFRHWGQIGLTGRPINLSFLTAAVIGAAHLPLAQLTALTLLFAAAVRTRACRTFTGTLRLMCLALTVFVLLNLLVWGYFFLLLELLLLLYVLSANQLLQDPVPPLSASHDQT